MLDPTVVRAAVLATARLRDLPAIAAAWLVVGVALAVTIGLATTSGGLAFAVRFAEVLAPFALGVAGWGGWAAFAHRQAADRLASVNDEGLRLQAAERQRWETDRQRHEAEQEELLEATAEWTPVGVAPQPRIDVFGGTLRSWCGLLTTFLTSVVHPGRAVIAIDLTTAEIVEEARHLCSLAQRSTQVVPLPDAASLHQLLRDVDGGAFADILVDLVHGSSGAERGEDRVLDARILRSICGALEPHVTPGRVQHAIRELLGEPVSDPVLGDAERERVTSSLFSEEFIQQTHGRFRVLEAYVSQLNGDGEAGEASDVATASLQCVVLSRRGEATADLYANLAIQWVTREVQRRPVQTVVVAGADRVPLPLLERLSQRCEEGHVQLVVLFQHLRDDVTRFVGGGRAAGFMRLGNHLEAEAAANFIGRGHRFVLSQVTRSHGGQSGESTSRQRGTGSSTSVQLVPGGLMDLLIGPGATARNEGYSTSWGSSLGFTEGTNWNVAESQQRVYEYQVEPVQLQGLPDYAMLLVTPEAAGARIRSVECSPDIATLPRVSPEALDLDGSVERAAWR